MTMPDHPSRITVVNMTLTLLQQSWPVSSHKLPLQVLYYNELGGVDMDALE